MVSVAIENLPVPQVVIVGGRSLGWATKYPRPPTTFAFRHKSQFSATSMQGPRARVSTDLRRYILCGIRRRHCHTPTHSLSHSSPSQRTRLLLPIEFVNGWTERENICRRIQIPQAQLQHPHHLAVVEFRVCEDVLKSFARIDSPPIL